MCWEALLTDRWDGKPACQSLDPDLRDSGWLLCRAGPTLDLFHSLLLSLLPGPLPGTLLAAPGDSVGRVCAISAQGQAVLGQTSVPWEGAALCPGIVIPSAWQCTAWTALSCMALAPRVLRITQVSSHLALARIHPALGTLTPAGAQSPPLLPF